MNTTKAGKQTERQVEEDREEDKEGDTEEDREGDREADEDRAGTEVGHVVDNRRQGSRPQLNNGRETFLES